VPWSALTPDNFLAAAGLETYNRQRFRIPVGKADGQSIMVPLRFLRRFLLVLGVVVALLLVRAAVVFRALAGEPELRSLQLLFAASTILIVILLVLGVYLLSGTLSARLRRLLAGMEGVRKGEYPLIKAEGEDEFTELARGFNHMVEELRSREERLHQWASSTQAEAAEHLPAPATPAMERLGSALEAAGDGVIVLDADRRVVMASWRVCEAFGVPMEALAGRDLAALLAQVRTQLKEPERAEEMLQQQQASPERLTEGALELSDPPGQSIKFYFAPMRGAYAAMVGRIAAALDAGRQKETERLKSEFLATISHELRTPLTSVKGSLGLVRGGAAGPISADMRELLEIAQTNTDRLIQVINDLLDITQLERGQAGMKIQPMRLSAAVADAMQIMAKEASKKRITLVSEVSDQLPAVRGDLKRITQVLVNLLSNGIKFSPPGEKVRVAARSDDGHVRVTVQDFGRGMSREFLGRVFSKFEHAQGSLTRDSQGVGLGLAISRHIIDSHQGAIWAESEPEKGSSFHFTLPAVESVPASTWAEEAAPAPGSEPRLILVIDDDEDVARVIAYVLKTQGHRVIAAHSGREGIELARRHRPDLITLDLIMDDLDGYAVLRSLRSAPETARIPVICISVQPDPSPALAQGADFYLEKPVDIEKLRALTQRALAAAQEPR
jgi:signal transduction histidine kinase/ActR/RegA family two-component response regulator/HAMP domain-containing protein